MAALSDRRIPRQLLSVCVVSPHLIWVTKACFVFCGGAFFWIFHAYREEKKEIQLAVRDSRTPGVSLSSVQVVAWRAAAGRPLWLWGWLCRCVDWEGKKSSAPRVRGSKRRYLTRKMKQSVVEQTIFLSKRQKNHRTRKPSVIYNPSSSSSNQRMDQSFH